MHWAGHFRRMGDTKLPKLTGKEEKTNANTKIEELIVLTTTYRVQHGGEGHKREGRRDMLIDILCFHIQCRINNMGICYTLFCGIA